MSLDPDREPITRPVVVWLEVGVLRGCARTHSVPSPLSRDAALEGVGAGTPDRCGNDRFRHSADLAQSGTTQA